MAMPARRVRRTGRRRFDLRATALFFAILALVLCAVGFAVRTVVETVERRPVWEVVLCLVAASVALALHRRRRRVCAARTARRAAEALEAATDTALEELETPDAKPLSPHLPRQADGAFPVSDVSVPQPSAGDYDALGPDEFEQAVAELCARDGCSDVEVVGGAGDLGADVLAVAPDGRRVVVQCKRYGDAHRVGSQDLQRFGGTCYTVHGADVAVVVTTSDFTTPAAEYAEQCGIVCVDGTALRAWNDGTGPAPWLLTPLAGRDVDEGELL
ncbi:restriction endonuclease [Streptomyces sp. Ru71]|uniref:restriction endonuclease n=1 Tax=Streptomyces sp. Ru71 TaxID=2080746 RepID=UPI0035BBCFA4